MGLYPILAKNEYCNREQYYRGVLPYLRRIISCIKRDGYHPCDQWSAGMKKYWRHSMSLNIGIIPYYYDPIENGKDPCKLPTNAIIIVGCDDTSKIQLGDLIPLEATPRQSNCAIFLSITSVLACDHDYISCIKRDGFHPCDQWNAGMNKYWRHSMSLNIGIIPYYYDPIENGKDPCKLPTNAIIIVGCDDTSKIQLGDLIPLEATPRQSNCAIFLSITSVLACDHDYGGVAKILPSVIHNMNQYINPGYSLYSGSPDGTGCAFLLLHDAKFYPSLGYNHAAHFNQF